VPYYTVNPNLGGISTAAGGSVTIKAGGNVISYLPNQTDYGSGTRIATDGGIGAFGPEAGDVSVTAGGQIVGNYVLANGTGKISAVGDIGNTKLFNGFTLSLIKGDWTVNDPSGTIYLEDVFNPNGVFNAASSLTSADRSPAEHYFDYDPDASVTLTGYGVQITGANVPLLQPDSTTPLPILLPPSLFINAGAGGLTLAKPVFLFPSADGELNINILDGGNFSGGSLTMEGPFANNQWNAINGQFAGLAGVSLEFNNPEPATINVSGDFENTAVSTTKQLKLHVDGDVINASVSAQNNQSSDATDITVGGQIYNSPGIVFTLLDNPIIGANSADPSAWDAVFEFAVSPSIANDTFGGDSPGQLIEAIGHALLLLFPNPTSESVLGSNPGFTYDPTTGKLGFAGNMSAQTLAELSKPLTVMTVVYNATYGWVPVLNASGHVETTTYNFLSAMDLNNFNTLYTESKAVPSQYPTGIQVHGPGTLNVTVDGNLELGNTAGIRTDGGATINLQVVDGDIDMLTSRITTTGGGDVNITCGGSIDLGSQYIYSGSGQDAFGIWASGLDSDVDVIADGDIDIDGSRIATYNSGNVFVESLYGSVNVGSGGNSFVHVSPFLNSVYGSGLLAISQPGNSPGDITVETPNGNIISSQAGILQLALGGGTVSGTPTITLTAGTTGIAPSATEGNIDLGDGGLIGYTTVIKATGNVSGLFISRQTSNIHAGLNFSGTVYSEGAATLNAGGSLSGTVIGIGSVNISGGQITATISSASASVNGGAAASTLGKATATASSQSAAQQSSSEAKQVAYSDGSNDGDDQNKKKPVLTRAKHVTVILPTQPRVEKQSKPLENQL
jgi:hypothetical protein